MGLALKYFVLKPDGEDDIYHLASRRALLEYAFVVANYNPELANDLRQWVKTIEDNLARTEISSN